MFEPSRRIEEEDGQCNSHHSTVSLSLPSVPYLGEVEGSLVRPLPSSPHGTPFNVILERSQIKAGNSVNFIGNLTQVQNSVPPLAPSVPTFIPPKPSTFVGREELLQRVILSLISLQNVALIGMGGMGKTFVAQAILNDAAISAAFAKRRYFARYDDIDISQMTDDSFSDRLASSIGLPSSGGNTLTRVKAALELSTGPTLLVLDNAETFLDSDYNGTIGNCINEVGALPNVVLLLTSRSTVLPTNVFWERVQVPSLDATSASDLFRRLYGRDLDFDTSFGLVYSLLKSVDFHPLSINLLAQAAVQNDWSPEELVKSWGQRQAAILHTGTAKAQSLAVTIALSVDSPSLQKHADTIRELLPVIAYLPQGINRSTVESMYPDLPHIRAITELLCKHSLTYVKGPFITMLAPIRIHFTRDFKDFTHMPMMKNVYDYYRSQLGKEPVDKGWILAEDLNIEHLLATFLGQREFMHLLPDVAPAVEDYILALSRVRPRPTSLLPIIAGLNSEPNRTLVDFFSYRRYRKRKVLSHFKGKLILSLGIMSHALGRLNEARRLFVEASRILKHAGKTLNIPCRSLTFLVAVAHLPLGGFKNAQEALEIDFARSRWWWWIPRRKFYLDTAAAVVLEAVKIAYGQTKDGRRLLRLAKAVSKVQDSEKYICGFCFTSIMMAARMLGQDEGVNKLVGFMLDAEETKFEGSILAADFALYEGDGGRAQQYLEAVDPLSPGIDPDDSITFYQLLAVCKYINGEVAEARLTAQNLTNQARFHDPEHPMAATASAWINGWIELHEGNLPAASAFMQKVVTLSKAFSNNITATLARRALGEIAFLQENDTEALAEFRHVTDLCAEMGILDTYLFECGWAFWRFDGRFEGWKQYVFCKALFVRDYVRASPNM